MILATPRGDIRHRTMMNDILSYRSAGISSAGTNAGVAVNNRTVSGIPAYYAAVSFAAEAVASLKMKVWQGDEPIRRQVNLGWQARLFRGTPNPQQTWFTFWETIEASHGYRNNAYIWKVKDSSGRIVELWALHPDQVSWVKNNTWAVMFNDYGYPRPSDVAGTGTAIVGSERLLHIRGRGGIGEVVAPSPIRLFATALGLSIAKLEHEAAIFANGAGAGIALTFPGRVGKEQADHIRDIWDGTHAGPYNAGRTKVVDNGAKIEVIGMTAQDVQLAELIELSILDVSRITRVPAWFLGIKDGTTKPSKPEHEQMRWLQHGLSPRLKRHEEAINADPDLFAGGLITYSMFDRSGLLRGDLVTEATTSVAKVQAGIWSQDEARAREGMPPWPDGMGATPQPVPVGGSPVGVNFPNEDKEDDD